MNRALVIAALACFFAACSSGDQPASRNTASTVDLSSLPVTVEGLLVADVGEGDVDEEGDGDEYSEFNFGTLTVGSEEIPVHVSGSVLRSANLPEAEGRVRATIGSKSEEYGHTYYQIISLQRL